MKLRDKVKEQAMQMREGDNQRSPLKGRFTRFIRHRMKWHASEYYRKHKPREDVIFCERKEWIGIEERSSA